MAKIFISDLAREVAKKHKLPQREIEQFVANMFAVVAEGLQQDKLVKIKGLGTFKVTQVKPRESVDVNTGERVLIDGHDKVTFTPDSLMKELVNKPFAQFETVVINENVDFSAIDAANPTVETDDVKVETPSADGDEPLAEEVEQPAEAEIGVEEPQTEPLEPEPVAEEESTDAPEPETATAEATLPQPSEQEGVSAEAPAEPKAEAPVAAESVAEQSEVEPETSTPEPEASTSELEASTPEPEAAPEVAQLFSAHGEAGEDKCEESPSEPAADFKEDSYLPADDDEAPSPRRNILKLLLGAVALAVISFALGYLVGKNVGPATPKQPQVAVAAADTMQTDTTAATQPATDVATPKPSDFETMNEDSRIKLGAYRIVGIDKEITLEAGQTMERYCRTQGGGSGFLVYYQVVNGVDSLSEGATMKVPKLELKRRK